MENKNIRVFLIDDEKDFTQSMAFWLKSKGYMVDVANEPKVGLKMIKDNPPDIVFLDLNMPEMDGVETLKEIRKFNKDLPVIIISAYVDEYRTRNTTSYGVSGIFYKGNDFNEGLVLLETALRTHKQLKK